MMRDRKDLWPYQKTAVDYIMDNPNFGLLMEMGLGKTVSTLTAINDLIWSELEIDTVLIVGPKRVAENVWSDEIAEWKHLNKLTYSIIAGKESERLGALKKKAQIYMVSRDNLAWLIGVHGGGKLPFDMLVIDESSSFKNPRSLRFKTLKPTLAHFKRVVILTGTPAPNGLMDLWAQIYLLDRGERLGKTITAFRSEYFTPGKRNGHIVFNYNLQKDGEQIIFDKIDDVVMSMKAKDYIDLPDRIDNPIRIPMTPALKKTYSSFEKDCVLNYINSLGQDDEITALNAAGLQNKLLQFANGAVYDADKNIHEVHDLKLKALADIIEDANGKPVLVGWTYRSDMLRMKEKFKHLNPRDLKTRQDILDWNDGKIQLLLMHPASGGHGLNIQRGGSEIVWFGQTWSLELLLQFNARLHRQGQKFPVTIHYLILEGSMDEDVIKSHENKNKTQDKMMEAVKVRINKYLNK